MRTTFHQSPFWLLGATTRDDRRRVVQLAEEKQLELEGELCQKARADLTNPRTRIACEMAWLPGVSPSRATQLVDRIQEDPISVFSETGLPNLAHANLMAAAFESVGEPHDSEFVADSIHALVSVVGEISAAEVLRDINEDRAVSGFPPVQGEEPIEAGLVERKRHYRVAIKAALNRLPAPALVDAMTKVVTEATKDGESHAPDLLDDLVDSYEIEAQGFLTREAANVEKLVATIRQVATRGEDAIRPLIDELSAVTLNWDRVAQPIQVSFMARGQDHDPSKNLAYMVRSLAVDLFNDHGMLDHAQQLTLLLQEVFAEVPQVVERVGEDAEVLEGIFEERRHAEARRDEWAREITYRADIGGVFKGVLSISPKGASWKDQHFALDAITRVRWGAIRHSLNGIPTGTKYTIAFGDALSEAVVELKRQEVYFSFVDKLYRAVGIRLLTELLESLAAGQEVHFGDALVRDTGISLTRHRFFGANELVHLSWDQVRAWNADGSFFIGSRERGYPIS
jgi:hypothetical protein